MSGILCLSVVAILAHTSVGSAGGDSAPATPRAAEVAQLKLEIAQLRQLLGANPPSSQAPERRLLFAPTPYSLPSGALTKWDIDNVINTEYKKYQEEKEDIAAAMDSLWLILCGALVMFMHPGFAMLETGCSRAKNAQNVLFKNMLNVTVGSLAWYSFGYSFAYGGPYDDDGFNANGFIGYDVGKFGNGFLTSDDDGNMAIAKSQSSMLAWFFQWAFCTAAATIVSGAVAQRVKSLAYTIYAFIMACFIYPVIVCWTWGYGWIAKVGDVGFMDFAGSGVVHLTGGISAFCGAAILGARSGWSPGDPAYYPHNMPIVVLGTFILWFGWYGFNCGSTLSLHDAGTAALAAQVAMNTTVSAAIGGITVFLVQFGLERKFDVGGLCNGILGGLVSITAGCGNVETGSAFLIGIVGGFVYKGSSVVVEKFGVDDPVDAASVHGACGVWGVLAAGLFDWGNGFDHFHGWSGFNCMTDENGACQTGIGGKVLGVNVLMVVVIILWAGSLSSIIFGVMKFTGLLRVDQETEKKGSDKQHHSPSKAYNFGT